MNKNLCNIDDAMIHLHEGQQIAFQAMQRGITVFRAMIPSFSRMIYEEQRAVGAMLYSIKHRVLINMPIYAGFLWDELRMEAISYFSDKDYLFDKAEILAVFSGSDEKLSFSNYEPRTEVKILVRESSVTPAPLIFDDNEASVPESVLEYGKVIMLPEERRMSVPLDTMENDVREKAPKNMFKRVDAIVHMEQAGMGVVIIPDAEAVFTTIGEVDQYQVILRVSDEQGDLRRVPLPSQLKFFPLAKGTSVLTFDYGVRFRKVFKLRRRKDSKSYKYINRDWRFFIKEVFSRVLAVFELAREEFGKSTIYMDYYSNLIRRSCFPSRMPRQNLIIQLMLIASGDAIDCVDWRVPINNHYCDWRYKRDDGINGLGLDVYDLPGSVERYLLYWDDSDDEEYGETAMGVSYLDMERNQQYSDNLRSIFLELEQERIAINLQLFMDFNDNDLFKKII